MVRNQFLHDARYETHLFSDRCKTLMDYRKLVLSIFTNRVKPGKVKIQGTKKKKLFEL
jgi:hypothetical protein